MKEQFILERLNGIKKHINAIEKHINTPKQQRPEPKFARGDMTDKGIINSIIRYDDEHGWLYERPDYIRFWEYELTAVPKSCPIITLFKVVDGNVETETNSGNDNADKDFMAELAFQNGYCAILVEQDGSKSIEYCKEIMALDGWNGLYLSDDDEIYVTTDTIQRAINHPKWIRALKCNGQSYKAYRLKNGDVSIQGANFRTDFDYNNPLWHVYADDDCLMPYILHGKG